jgi:putative salt-induced outer membrane protein
MKRLFAIDYKIPEDYFMKYPDLKCLAVALLLTLFFLSAAQADQVVLKNGDRLTGAIIKKDGNNITVKTSRLGVIVAPWDQVESIITEKPLYLVLQDGKTIQGMLSASGGKAEIATSNGNTRIQSADIATIRNDDEEKAYQLLLRPGWGQLWAGTGTIGFAGTSGNAKTLTFTTGLNAGRATNRDKTALYFSFIKASSMVNNVDSDTAEAIRGGISYGHNVTSRLFFNVFNDYEYDRFQNLDLRFVLGGGAGYQALKTDRHRLDFLAGAAYNRSSFSTPLIRKSGELYWGDEYSLKLSSATSLTQSYRMFNDRTRTGDYRINFDAGLNARLFKWLSWNVSLSDRYLNNPAPGRKNNDFLYTTGLGISFSK